MIKQCITDEEVCKSAAKEEIIRRYYNTLCDFKQRICDEKTVKRSKALMDKLELSLEDRKVAKIANEKAKEKGLERMPRIVIVVDELADLMMVAKKEVETDIYRSLF